MSVPGLDDSGRQHFVYFNLLLPLAPGGHVLVNDGIVLYEGEGQGLLLQRGGWTGWRGLEAVPAFAGGEAGGDGGDGGESHPGYVVMRGDEGESLAGDSAVAPGTAGDGGRWEGRMVGLTSGPGLATGDLPKSHSAPLAQEVISPGAISPLLTELDVEASEGAGRPKRMNPRVRVRLPPELVFSEWERHAGVMFPSDWSEHY